MVKRREEKDDGGPHLQRLDVLKRSNELSATNCAA
jgi:hypothetical protein